MSETKKPWLNRYPKGVSPEINPEEFLSLAALIESTCERFSSRTAFSNMGCEWSFSEIQKASTDLAAFFQNELGLKKGDRIILQMPNLLQYPIALFAALRAGLTVVNINPLYTPDEMEHSFRDCGAETIVILENFAEKLEKVLPKTKIKNIILTEIGDLLPAPRRILVNFVVRHVKKMVPRHSIAKTHRFRAALEKGSRYHFSAPPIGSDDLAFLQYTGGTTGVSKAAMLTHRNMVANLLQMTEWMKPGLTEGQERVIAALPLYHVFCLTVNCMGLFHLGAHNILITNPRDLPTFIKTLSQTRPTVLTAVSTLLAGLLQQPKFAELNLKTLKVTVAGGMALKASVADEWKRRTGTSVIEGYGLTEASPVVSCNPLDGNDRLGTIGMPLPSTDVKIVGEDGKTLPLGEPGELCVFGPQVMKGYWNQVEETRKVIDSDGWLHTGDIAAMDPDGYFRIVDRKKDMVLVSGFNVYPNEVEDVVMKLSKVAEAAVTGVPDDRSGEVVKLFVVKRDESLTEQEIRDHCRQHLAAYKCPKYVEFRKELPKTNVGKILRRALKSSKF